MSSSSSFRRSSDSRHHSSRYDYNDRRDGERERDRRDRDLFRDYHRSPSRSTSPDKRVRETERDRAWNRDRDDSRDREVERERDRPKDLDRDRSKTQIDPLRPPPPAGQRDTLPPTRTFSSPVLNKSGIPMEPRPNRGSQPSPRRPPTVSTTPASSAPASSAPPTPRSANDTTSTAKITAALRQLTQRSNEQGALQLRKDVVEARAKTREREHAQSHPKYAEFPSLREYHQKLEKRDTGELDALRREVKIADQQWQASAEAYAAAMLQAMTELQLKDKDRRQAVPSAQDGLETRLNTRLDALEKQHKEASAKQKKQIEELQESLSTETLQREALGIENEALKKKVQELQDRHQSLTSKADDHGASIKRLQEKKPDVVSTQAPPQQNAVTTDELTEVKTLVNQYEDRMLKLENQVLEHDGKLGEMDIDLISDSCSAVATTLPRLEQNVKKAAEDIIVLRAEHKKLGSDTDISRSGVEQLRSDIQQQYSHAEKIQTNVEQIMSETAQLKSETDCLKRGADEIKCDAERLKTNTQQLRSDTDYVMKGVEKLEYANEHIKIEAQQLKSEMTQLQSGIEKLGSEIPRPPDGDNFLAVKAFKNMNVHVFETYHRWIEDVKKRIDIVERQMPTLQTDAVSWAQLKTLEKGSDQKSNRSTENSRLSTPTSDSKTAVSYEGKLKDYDTRIRVLEAVSSQSPRRSVHALSEPADFADAAVQRHASNDSASIKVAIEALKAQLSMIDQSIKAVSESAKLASDSQAEHSERIRLLETQAYDLRADHQRLDDIEQRFVATEEKVQAAEGKIEFVQHNFMGVDAQMNNLTTESLYQAILQHIDRYQPTEAALGPKVDQMARQVIAYEQRLIFLERQMASKEEPANKKRRLSPQYGPVAMTNGRH
ncbi:hypothetical protein CORC01_07109 [Colletotrichum orchidophilum]|uniref:Uncharacterized protein n=1 Tax=Colletotrichum orchidophilum TaxID=1209926 RepID=A0A1G4B8I9_9PEZI|nr:uncharacterized protein CORC01_07109 [Colletotrichum orchidophilum]OHE97694.1 hypothetical protein CORC01_07109 [Colletotrichum orchidophilum]